MDYAAYAEAVTTTASIVVAAADVDRHVEIYAPQSKIGFDATSTVYPISALGTAPTRFVLPAGTDLYGVADSNTDTIYVLVTGIRG